MLLDGGVPGNSCEGLDIFFLGILRISKKMRCSERGDAVIYLSTVC